MYHSSISFFTDEIIGEVIGALNENSFSYTAIYTANGSSKVIFKLSWCAVLK